MPRVVEMTAGTYEAAVQKALEDLGLEREQAQVVLLRTRDLDLSRPGPEEYTVRVWRRRVDDDAEDDVVTPRTLVCEQTAETLEEAVHACLEKLGIDEAHADIQILPTDESPGGRPALVTARVWRRSLTEPAVQPDAPGAETIHEIHAAAHLPTDDELNFLTPRKD